jgi:hypothetical protein
MALLAALRAVALPGFRPLLLLAPLLGRSHSLGGTQGGHFGGLDRSAPALHAASSAVADVP